MVFFEKIQEFISGLTSEKIIQFLIAPQFSGWLLVLKIFFIILSFFLVGFIIFVLIKTSWLKRLVIWDWYDFLTYKPFESKKTEREWQEIKIKLTKEMESEWKLAIIEADEILDRILSQIGFEGANLGEKLRKLPADYLLNAEEVKEAHQIRNNIIHDPTYKLSLEEAKKVISVYEKALIDLHFL